MTEITASESVRIDKELERIPKIIEQYSGYYYTVEQKLLLRKMRDEIAEVFNFVFVDIDDDPTPQEQD